MAVSETRSLVKTVTKTWCPATGKEAHGIMARLGRWLERDHLPPASEVKYYLLHALRMLPPTAWPSNGVRAMWRPMPKSDAAS